MSKITKKAFAEMEKCLEENSLLDETVLELYDGRGDDDE